MLYDPEYFQPLAPWAVKLGSARCMGALKSWWQHRPGAVSLVSGHPIGAQSSWRRLGSLAHTQRSSNCAAMQSAHPVQWNEDVDKHMHRAFGSDWAAMKSALSTPPPETCVRVNTHQTTVEVTGQWHMMNRVHGGLQQTLRFVVIMWHISDLAFSASHAGGVEGAAGPPWPQL